MDAPFSDLYNAKAISKYKNLFPRVEPCLNPLMDERARYGHQSGYRCALSADDWRYPTDPFGTSPAGLSYRLGGQAGRA